jgi:DUF971 family protein
MIDPSSMPGFFPQGGEPGKRALANWCWSRMLTSMDPKKIDILDTGELKIVWKDAATSQFSPRDLRLACPCAQCVEEWTGRKLLDEGTVADGIVLLDVSLVGRYALTFKWSDLHETGIFTFDLLRRMGNLPTS